jgi:hypothetical protein
VHVLGDSGQVWTVARLRRAVGKLVAQHMADPALLKPALRRKPEERLMTIAQRNWCTAGAYAGTDSARRAHMVGLVREEATRPSARGWVSATCVSTRSGPAL